MARYSKSIHFQFVGQKFNRLTVKEFLFEKKGKARVVAQCDCGVVKEYYLFNIKNGETKSCGCLNDEVRSKKMFNLKHGLYKHPLISVWNGIHQRCYNEKSSGYEGYGSKGVKMCDEWKNDFKPFYDWAIKNGWKKGLEIDKDIIPKKLSIPALLYSPEYCSIVTGIVNKRNTSRNIMVTYNGEVKCIAEWASLYGINYNTLLNRIIRGMKPEQAFVKTIYRSNQYTKNKAA